MAASAAPSPTISCRPWTKLLDRPEPPDHIVIETSGLALPQAPGARPSTGPRSRPRVTVDGVITVVDGPALAAGRFADDPDGAGRAARRRSHPRSRQPDRRALRGPAHLRRPRGAQQDRSPAMRRRGGRGAAIARHSCGRARQVVPRELRARSIRRVLLGLGAAAEDDLATAAHRITSSKARTTITTISRASCRAAGRCRSPEQLLAAIAGDGRRP